MQEYHNKSCAQCGEKFSENDNIAICPDCGTPIHKNCWNGHCPNEAKHAEGFDWNKSEAAEAYKKVSDIGKPDKSMCAVCGEAADSDMIYCPDCGTPMHRSCYAATGSCPNEANHGKKISEHEFFRDDGFENPPMMQIRSISDFTRELKAHPIKDHDTGEELTCCGIKQTELISFLGENNIGTPRLVMTFLRMANSKRKASVNFFAGLFMPYYQFYQRMIGPALILLFLEIILSIPAVIYNINYALNGSASLGMSNLGGMVEILSFIGIAIQILVAVFNDYIYMRWSVNKILNLREKYKDSPESRYMEALAKAGAPKFSCVLIGFGIMVAFSLIMTLIYF